MTFNVVPEAEAKKLERVAKCYKRKYKNIVLLDQIVEGGHKIVKINWRDDGYKNLRSAQASLYKSVQKHGHGLVVFANDGQLYVANPKLIDVAERPEVVHQ